MQFATQTSPSQCPYSIMEGHENQIQITSLPATWKSVIILLKMESDVLSLRGGGFDQVRTDSETTGC